eukprot:Skav211248  [mRNA]  locus=scaffold3676:17907:19601:+ [translate_table: standard]
MVERIPSQDDQVPTSALRVPKLRKTLTRMPSKELGRAGSKESGRAGSKEFGRVASKESPGAEERKRPSGIDLGSVVSAQRLQRRMGTRPMLRLGSALEVETGQEGSPTAGPSPVSPPQLIRSPTNSTTGSFRRKVRRSLTMLSPAMPAEEETVSSHSSPGGSRLKMLTSAVSMFQAAVEKKVEDVFVGDPNEVILDSDDDSDDEEEEETERDFVSALQRVQDSGRLSIHELPVFEKELKETVKIFEGESDMAILASLQRATYLETKPHEILWSRYSELYSGIISVECPICMVVRGRVSIAKPGAPEGVKVLKGSVITAGDPEVLGFVATEPCKLLYIDLSQAEEDLNRAKRAWGKVDTHLREELIGRWPEELLDDLLLCVQHQPFFENFDHRTLRSILPQLQFQHMPIGQSLPPRPIETSPGGTQSQPECHLVMLWEGKAGKYKRVQSENQQMLCTQLDLMALEGLTGRTAKGGPTTPNDKDIGELDETQAVAKDNKIYLKRYGNLRLGSVLGQRDLIDPGGPETGQPIVRCEGPCYVLTLARPDYLQCLKECRELVAWACSML